MALQNSPSHISAEDYLQGELLSDIKHQLIDGEVYAMAVASENHNLLALNIAGELRNHLKGTPCRTFMSDMKVRIAEDFFYPDVMVVCDQDNEDEYYKKSPIIIVEVLSKTTRKFDQTSTAKPYPRCKNTCLSSKTKAKYKYSAAAKTGNRLIIIWAIRSPSIR